MATAGEAGSAAPGARIKYRRPRRPVPRRIPCLRNTHGTRRPGRRRRRPRPHSKRANTRPGSGQRSPTRKRYGSTRVSWVPRLLLGHRRHCQRIQEPFPASISRVSGGQFKLRRREPPQANRGAVEAPMNQCLEGRGMGWSTRMRPRCTHGLRPSKKGRQNTHVALAGADWVFKLSVAAWAAENT